jgi:F-type H+-transporting ATPase subunit epsilon
MRSFTLKIVTPDGMVFDGQAESLTLRTTTGELGILAGHTNLVAPLGQGRCTIVMDGKRRNAACIGGMVSVIDGDVTMIPTTFEWAEDIDFQRAERSYERAQTVLSNKESSKTDLTLAEARMKRALVRKSVASMK